MRFVPTLSNPKRWQHQRIEAVSTKSPTSGAPLLFGTAARKSPTFGAPFSFRTAARKSPTSGAPLPLERRLAKSRLSQTPRRVRSHGYGTYSLHLRGIPSQPSTMPGKKPPMKLSRLPSVHDVGRVCAQLLLRRLLGMEELCKAQLLGQLRCIRAARGSPLRKLCHLLL